VSLRSRITGATDPEAKADLERELETAQLIWEDQNLSELSPDECREMYSQRHAGKCEKLKEGTQNVFQNYSRPLLHSGKVSFSDLENSFLLVSKLHGVSTRHFFGPKGTEPLREALTEAYREVHQRVQLFAEQTTDLDEFMRVFQFSEKTSVLNVANAESCEFFREQCHRLIMAKPQPERDELVKKFRLYIRRLDPSVFFVDRSFDYLRSEGLKSYDELADDRTCGKYMSKGDGIPEWAELLDPELHKKGRDEFTLADLNVSAHRLNFNTEEGSGAYSLTSIYDWIQKTVGIDKCLGLYEATAMDKYPAEIERWGYGKGLLLWKAVVRRKSDGTLWIPSSWNSSLYRIWIPISPLWYDSTSGLSTASFKVDKVR
jgi:hypothetical protein